MARWVLAMIEVGWLCGCGRVGFDPAVDGANLGDAIVPGDVFVPMAPSHVSWTRTIDAIRLDNVTGLGFGDDGTTYISGNFDGTADFGTGSITANSGGLAANLYLAAYDLSGAPRWVKTVGRYVRHQRLAVERDGHTTVTGQVVGDSDWGASMTTNADTSGAMYVVRFDATGTRETVLMLDGADSQEGFAVLGTPTSLVVAGRTVTPFSAGSVQLADMFLAELDPATGNGRWSMSIAPFAGTVNARRIIRTTEGRLAFAGLAQEPIDVGTGPQGGSSTLFGFLAMLEPGGTGAWLLTVDGPGDDQILAVLPAPDGGVFIAGTFSDQATIGSMPLPRSSFRQGFLARIAADGGINWLKTFSATDDMFAHGLAVDDSGSLYVTGAFAGETDVAGSHLMSRGAHDIWIAAFEPDGAPRWAASFGGPGSEESLFVAVHSSGTLCVAGEFTTSFDVGAGLVPSAGAQDGFVACFDR